MIWAFMTIFHLTFGSKDIILKKKSNRYIFTMVYYVLKVFTIFFKENFRNLVIIPCGRGICHVTSFSNMLDIRIALFLNSLGHSGLI